MTLSATSGIEPFSARDAWVFPFSGGVPGTGKDAAGIVSVTTTPNSTDIEHRGDDQVLSKGSTLDSIDVELVVGYWTLDVIAAMVGGTYTATVGTAPNQTRKLVHKVTDAPADFAIQAQTISKSPGGGGLRMTFPRCQANGIPDYGLTDAEYQDLTIPAAAIADSTQQIVIIEEFETYTALSATYAVA